MCVCECVYTCVHVAVHLCVFRTYTEDSGHNLVQTYTVLWTIYLCKQQRCLNNNKDV